MRNPRTFTCWSARPTNSNTPSQRQRARSPPPYIRLPADQHRKALESFTAIARQRMPKCRRSLKQRGTSLLDHARKGARIADDLSWGDGDTSTADEGKKQFES